MFVVKWKRWLLGLLASSALTGPALAGGAYPNPASIATNGLVPRNLNDRFADAANVLDYGADPTGAADSTSAFQAALAATRFGVRRNVYAPAGTYHLTNSITVGTTANGQALLGDGGNTVLDVSTDFNTSALGVVIIAGDWSNTNGVGTYPTIDGIKVLYHQPADNVVTATATASVGATTVTLSSVGSINVGDYIVDNTNFASIVNWTTTGATVTWPSSLTTVTNIAGNVVTLSNAVLAPGVSNGDSIHTARPRAAFKTLSAGCSLTAGAPGCKYPWAIYGNGMGVPTVKNIKVENGWDGLYLHGVNGTGSTNAMTVSDLYLGVLDIAVDVDNIHNSPYFNNWFLWDFGLQSRSAYIFNYYDSNLVFANLGATDGMVGTNFLSWSGKLNLTSNWSWGSISNLNLDGNGANFSNASSSPEWTLISNVYITKGNVASPAVSISGLGYTSFHNFWTQGNWSVPAIQVTGGVLEVTGGTILQQNTATSAATVTGGLLSLQSMNLLAHGGAYSAPYVAQTGASGRLHIQGVNFAPGNTGAAVSIATDNSDNVVLGNDFNSWTFASPGPLGIYQPDLQILNVTAAAGNVITLGGYRSGVGVASSASFSTFFGNSAGGSDGAGMTGIQNTGFGYKAGNVLTTGTTNAFFGSSAGKNETTGSGNAIFGANAMSTGAGSVANSVFGALSFSTPTAPGTANSIFGYAAANGQASSTGVGNSVFGYSAMNSAAWTTAGSNSVFGANTMTAITSGSANVVVGYGAAAKLTTGANNVIIGTSVASTTQQTGGNNILIGNSSSIDTPAFNSSNELNIGNLLFYNMNSTAAPAVSSCGTSPSIDAKANNHSGTVTAGTAAPASCTITFAGSGYSTWNHCRVTSQSVAANFAYSYSLTALTVTATSLNADKIDYDCDGY